MSEMMSCIAENVSLEAKTAHCRPQFLFVAGLMQRSGTTYLGRILAAHPELRRPQGHMELPLLEVAERFLDFHGSFSRLRKDERMNYSFDDFAQAFGRGFLELLQSRVADSAGNYKYLFHSNVSTQGIEYLRRFFPGAKIVFLVRDGRDNINSLMAAHGYAKGTWWNARRQYIFCKFCQRWAAGARRTLTFANDPDSDCLILNYKELTTDTTSQLKRLASYLDIEPHEEWVEAVEQMPVKGSTFYRQTARETPETVGSACWHEVPRTDAFKPNGRWRESWSKSDRYLFEKIAGKELRALGYC